LSNYTEEASKRYAKVQLAGYTLVRPLNILKAFILDHYKTKVKQVVDLMLVQGKWSTSVASRSLSDEFQKSLQILKEVQAFDSSLADDQEVGLKLRSALFRIAGNKQKLDVLRVLLKRINNNSREFLTQSVHSCIELGKMLRLIVEDRGSGRGEYIINWKELESFSEASVTAQINTVYQLLYKYVRLLKLVTGSPAGV
jgi:hypothetical protein